VWGNSIGAGTR